jgi:hypothetical protein
MVVRLVFISRTHTPRHVRIHIHIGRERREGGESEDSAMPSPRLGGPLSLEYVAWSLCRAFDALCPVRLPTHCVSIDRVSIRGGGLISVWSQSWLLLHSTKTPPKSLTSVRKSSGVGGRVHPEIRRVARPSATRGSLWKPLTRCKSRLL